MRKKIAILLIFSLLLGNISFVESDTNIVKKGFTLLTKNTPTSTILESVILMGKTVLSKESIIAEYRSISLGDPDSLPNWGDSTIDIAGGREANEEDGAISMSINTLTEEKLYMRNNSGVEENIASKPEQPSSGSDVTANDKREQKEIAQKVEEEYEDFKEKYSNSANEEGVKALSGGSYLSDLLIVSALYPEYKLHDMLKNYRPYDTDDLSVLNKEQLQDFLLSSNAFTERAYYAIKKGNYFVHEFTDLEYVDFYSVYIPIEERAYYIPKQYKNARKDGHLISHGSSFTPVILPAGKAAEEALNQKGGLGPLVTAPTVNRDSGLAFEISSLHPIGLANRLRNELNINFIDKTGYYDFIDSKHPDFKQTNYEPRYKGVTLANAASGSINPLTPIKNQEFARSTGAESTLDFKDINLIPKFWTGGYWNTHFGYNNYFKVNLENEAEHTKLERATVISYLRNGGPEIRGFVKEMEDSLGEDFPIVDFSKKEIQNLGATGFFSKDINPNILKRFNSYEDYRISRLLILAYGEYLRNGDLSFIEQDNNYEDSVKEVLRMALIESELTDLDTPGNPIEVHDLPIDRLQYLMSLIKKSQAYENNFYNFFSRSVPTRLYEEFNSSGSSSRVDYTISQDEFGIFRDTKNSKKVSPLDYLFVEQLPSATTLGNFAVGVNDSGDEKYRTHFISPYKSIIDLPDFSILSVGSYKKEEVSGDMLPTKGSVSIVGDDNYVGIDLQFDLQPDIPKSTLESFKDLIEREGIDLLLSVQLKDSEDAVPIDIRLKPNSSYVQKVLSILEGDILGNLSVDRHFTKKIYIPINTLNLEQDYMKDTDLSGENPIPGAKYLNMMVSINSDALREGLLLMNDKDDIYIPDSTVTDYISEFNFNNNYQLVSIPVKQGTPDLILGEVKPMNYEPDVDLPDTATSDLDPYTGLENAQIDDTSNPGVEMQIISERPFDTTLPIKLDYTNLANNTLLGEYNLTEDERKKLSSEGEITLLLPIEDKILSSDDSHWNSNVAKVRGRVNVDQLNGEKPGFLKEKGYTNNVKEVDFTRLGAGPMPGPVATGNNYIDYNELVSSLSKLPEDDKFYVSGGEFNFKFTPYGDARNSSIDNVITSGRFDRVNSLSDKPSTYSSNDNTKSGYDNVRLGKITMNGQDFKVGDDFSLDEFLSEVSQSSVERNMFYSKDKERDGLIVSGDATGPTTINSVSDLLNQSWEGQLFGIREAGRDKPTLGKNNNSDILSNSKQPYSESFNDTPVVYNSYRDKDIILEVKYDSYSYSYKRHYDEDDDPDGYKRSSRSSNGTKTLKYKLNQEKQTLKLADGSNYNDNEPIEVKIYNSDTSEALGLYPKVNSIEDTKKESANSNYGPTLPNKGDQSIEISWYDDPIELDTYRLMYDYRKTGKDFTPVPLIEGVVSDIELTPGAYTRYVQDFSKVRFDFDESTWVEDPTNSRNGTMGALHFNFNKTPFIPRDIASANSYWYSNEHNPNKLAVMSSGYGFQLGTNGRKKIGELTYLSAKKATDSSEIPGFLSNWLNSMNNREAKVRTNMNSADTLRSGDFHSQGKNFPYLPDRFSDSTTPEPIVDQVGENEYQIQVGNFTYTAERIGSPKWEPLEYNPSINSQDIINKGQLLGKYNPFDYTVNLNSILSRLELLGSGDLDKLPLYHKNLDIRFDLDGDGVTAHGAPDYVEFTTDRVGVEEIKYAIYVDVPSDVTHYSHRRMPDHAEVYFQLLLDRIPTGAGGTVNNLNLRSKPSWMMILGEISDALN